MNAILVHGFNVWDDGAGTVGRLAPYFAALDFRVQRMRYGWRFLLGAAALNRTFSRVLADLSDEGDIAIGHSNGCAIISAALARGAPFPVVVLINPALDRDHVFPVTPHLRAIHVWHSPSDEPVRLARLLPWSAWGDMGAVGYQGPADARVRNFNKQSLQYPVRSTGHSDVFAPDKLAYFGPLIARTAGKTYHEIKLSITK